MSAALDINTKKIRAFTAHWVYSERTKRQMNRSQFAELAFSGSKFETQGMRIIERLEAGNMVADSTLIDTMCHGLAVSKTATDTIHQALDGSKNELISQFWATRKSHPIKFIWDYPSVKLRKAAKRAAGLKKKAKKHVAVVRTEKPSRRSTHTKMAAAPVLQRTKTGSDSELWALAVLYKHGRFTDKRFCEMVLEIAGI